MALKQSRRSTAITAVATAPTSGPASRANFGSVSDKVGAAIMQRAKNGLPLLQSGFRWPYRARSGEPYAGANVVLLTEQAAAAGLSGCDAFCGRGDAFAMGYEKPASTPVLVTGTYHGYIDIKDKEKSAGDPDADEPKATEAQKGRVRVLRTFEVAAGASLGMKDVSALPFGLTANGIELCLREVNPKASPTSFALAFELMARVVAPTVCGQYPDKELVAQSANELSKPSVWSDAAYAAQAAMEKAGISLARLPVEHDRTKATERDAQREAYQAVRKEYRVAKKEARLQGVVSAVTAPPVVVFTDW